MLNKVEELVSPVLANLGYELVDRELAVEGDGGFCASI